jgi:hypothetical protein
MAFISYVHEFMEDYGPQRWVHCTGQLIADPTAAAPSAAAAPQALKMTSSTLGKSSLRVLPSKTAIVPVNKELMPRSEEELERCSRTVYVANIDKKVEREDVRTFFEKLCGEWGEGAVGGPVGCVEACMHSAQGRLTVKAFGYWG